MEPIAADERIVTERLRRKLDEVNRSVQTHFSGIEDHVNFTLQVSSNIFFYRFPIISPSFCVCVCVCVVNAIRHVGSKPTSNARMSALIGRRSQRR